MSPPGYRRLVLVARLDISPQLQKAMFIDAGWPRVAAESEGEAT